MSGLRRGFKTWCENASLGYRRDLGLSRDSALDPRALAKKLGILIATPGDLPGLPEEALHQLLVVDPSSWSAATLSSGGRNLIIFNPTHPVGRINNTLTHEIAHIVLEHEAAKALFTPGGLLMMKSYNKTHEEEADCLAAAILIPRQALLDLLATGMSDSALATYFGVSLELLRMRKNLTGVERQLGRRSGAS